LTETTGTIYISPATDDDNQMDNHTITRNCLLDPSFDGYFYRTDASIIEQWQLWDDEGDITATRPRPPPSPFGQHEGLYHDDMAHEIHQYLRHMDDEENSSSSSSSSSSGYRRHKERIRLNRSFLRSQTGLFDPLSIQNNMEIKKPQQIPIIIEKVVPNPIIRLPQNRSRHVSEETQQISVIDTYQINDRGHKKAKERNRTVFMDLAHLNNAQSQPRRRRRRSKHVPIFDLQTIKNLSHDRKSKQRRQSSIDTNEKSTDHSLPSIDMLEIVDGYFEDYKGKKVELNGRDAQIMLDQLQSSTKEKRDDISSIDSSNYEIRRRNHSTLSGGPSVSYGEHPVIIPPSPHSTEQMSNYETNIKSIDDHEIQSDTNTVPDLNVPSHLNDEFISVFRYMQSSVNPLLLRNYSQRFTGN
jgi:hypothetical protein